MIIASPRYSLKAVFPVTGHGGAPASGLRSCPIPGDGPDDAERAAASDLQSREGVTLLRSFVWTVRPLKLNWPALRATAARA